MKRITAAAVIAGPIVFLLANLLHPKEYTRNHEAQQLQTIWDNYNRWQIAHFLTFVAIMIFVVAILGLAAILYSRRPGMAIAGGVLALWGLVALGGVLAIDGFTWGSLGQVYGWPSADRATVMLALHSVQHSHWGWPFYAGGLAWIAGLLVLSIGLLRAGLVTAWAGWLFAAGVVLVGIEAGVESNAYFVVAAAVLALGGIGVGLGLRYDDHEHSTSSGNVQPG